MLVTLGRLTSSSSLSPEISTSGGGGEVKEDWDRKLKELHRDRVRGRTEGVASLKLW